MQNNFNFCPKCSSKNFNIQLSSFTCKDCTFQYFHNVAAAVAVILRFKNEILFVIRNQEPKKNFLDLPGGFVDPFEKSEQTVIRELKEELNIDFTNKNIEYLGSNPNQYEYKNIVYNTLDLFYEIILEKKPDFILDELELNGFKWILINEIPFDLIAFESQKKFLNQIYIP